MNEWDEVVKAEDQSVSLFLKGLKAFWHLIAPRRKELITAVIILTVVRLMELVFPYLMKIVFDELNTLRGTEQLSKNIVFFILLLFLTRFLGRYIKHFWQEPIFVKSIVWLENWWPGRAFEKLSSLQLSYHEQRNTGKTSGKINKGCDRLVDTSCTFFYGVIPPTVFLFLNICFIVAMDWRLGLIFSLPIIPAVMILVAAHKKFAPIWNAWDEKKEVANGLFCQAVKNMKTVQNFVQEETEVASFNELREEMRVLDLDAVLRIQKYNFAISQTLDLSYLLTILAGLYFAMRGSVTPGTVIFVFGTGNVALGGLWMIIDGYTKILKNMVSIQRMQKLMNEPLRVTNHPEAVIPKHFIGKFELNSVTYSYCNKQYEVFQGISLEFLPNNMTALVGKSGEGKSTIIRLLTRTDDVTHGCITLDGQDIRTIDRSWYRRLFAIVQQAVDIFDASIGKNVCYGYPNASREEILEAIHAAHLGNVISDTERFPEGLETQVGEQGVQLSGGERQRVGIARAYISLLRGARVLILDEATSNLDSEAEKSIQEMIAKLRKQTKIAIIVIAHRLSTIKEADCIYVIEGGKILEHGNHERLIANIGLYRRLVDLQGLTKNATP